jgi:hypothetical protein
MGFFLLSLEKKGIMQEEENLETHNIRTFCVIYPRYSASPHLDS